MNQEDLKRVFSYDPENGFFTLALDRGPKKSGSRSGFVSDEGYVCIFFMGKSRLAHRLAWLYTFGVLPSLEIDHINGIKTDNRIANLRLASRAQNQANIGLSSRNRSGVKGVSWDAPTQKWRVQAMVSGKYTSIGRFEKLEDAIESRKKAHTREYGEFARA